ncbi:MAG: metallophosphoesterase [Myxococcota bacterium]|nr:metallophosphoesterase [Myxococcota bacterium]
MRFAVLGDLHLDPDDARFARASEQLRALSPGRVICLGDFGNGKASGTRASFERARCWLEALDVPFESLLGNHDLERVEVFASDDEVVRSYCDAMRIEKPYDSFDLGEALGITLSSTAFRNKRGYAHEVSIDEAQFAWFADTLERHRDRPVFVFSHAPPLGSRLRVLQHPHLRGGNAWLNQSNGPRRFSRLLERHPQVRLWFSGHNHLGQDHPRALSHVGRCLFVHTGVIGAQSRDGRHHSRLLDFEGGRVSIETLDHTTGAQRVAAEFDLMANTVTQHDVDEVEVAPPCFAAPGAEILGSDSQRGSLGRSVMVESQAMLVEFDRELEDPVGVVSDNPRHRTLGFEGDQLVAGGAANRLRVFPNDDGYYFAIPSRNRRLLGSARIALRALARRVLAR